MRTENTNKLYHVILKIKFIENKSLIDFFIVCIFTKN